MQWARVVRPAIAYKFGMRHEGAGNLYRKSWRQNGSSPVIFPILTSHGKSIEVISGISMESFSSILEMQDKKAVFKSYFIHAGGSKTNRIFILQEMFY